MDVSTLNETELTELQSTITNRLNQIKADAYKPVSPFKTLGEVEGAEDIFIVEFDGDKIHYSGFTKILLTDKSRKNAETRGYFQFFLVYASLSPLVNPFYLDKHFVFTQLNGRMLFCTLQPKTWTKDIATCMDFETKLIKESQRRELNNFRHKISNINVSFIDNYLAENNQLK